MMQQWEYCSMMYDYEVDAITIIQFRADGKHNRQDRRPTAELPIPEVPPVVFPKKRRGQKEPPAELQAAIERRRLNRAFFVDFQGQLMAELGAEGWEMMSGSWSDETILFKRPVAANRD